MDEQSGLRYSWRWHSVEEVMAHLGVARDTVYRWIDRKGLPAHRIGKLWKFKLAEVDDRVRSRGADREDRKRTRLPSTTGSPRPPSLSWETSAGKCSILAGRRPASALTQRWSRPG
jgi:excisionase family DNA binding protein